jgi:hypothetical protein
MYSAARPALPTKGWLRALLLGGGVWLFERLVFPRFGVTPPARSWSPAERHWLAVQTLLFGLVTEAVLSRVWSPYRRPVAGT